MKKALKWTLVPLAAAGCIFAVRFGVASFVNFPSVSETANVNVSEISGKNELPPPAPAAVDLPADFKAEAAEVFDLSCGCKILSFRENYRWPLASLTKLMTAVVALEDIGADKTIVVGKNAIEPAAADFIPGEEFSAADLVKAMMMTSSNAAAAALADSLPEGEFVRKMNAKAAEIGLSETSFFEPTGLSVLNQSTAEDVIKLAGYINDKHPVIFEASRRTKGTILERKTGRSRSIANINSFAGRSDFLGGKTGYTEEAKGNLLSLFRTAGGTAFFVVFGTADRFAETEKLLNQVNGLGSD